MRVNEFPRFPDLNRLGPISISEAELRDWGCRRHGYHHATLERDSEDQALPRLPIDDPILKQSSGPHPTPGGSRRLDQTIPAKEKPSDVERGQGRRSSLDRNKE